MPESRWRAGLNDEQLAAVEHDGGPALVLAGPGTGKTHVITRRVARLVEQRGIRPESILALTFTVKAANELRSRLIDLIGPGPADRVVTGTFHSFGLRLIRRFGDLIGVPATAQLVDSTPRRRLMRQLIRDHQLAVGSLSAGWEPLIDDLTRWMQQLRQAGCTPEQCERYAQAWAERCRTNEPGWDDDALAAQRHLQAQFAQRTRLYRLYSEAALAQGYLSFEDLLVLALQILRDCPEACAICRDEHRHIVVDEFQDVDRAQIELLYALAPPVAPDRPDLMVVGDDDQSIYSFRGADVTSFARFAQLWPEHQVITLTTNYRSEQPILRVAQAIMARATTRFAPDKTLHGVRAGPDAPAVECVTLADMKHDGTVIAAMIQADRARVPDRPLSAYAVICRNNAQLHRVAAALELEGIPSRLSEPPSPIDDDGVQYVFNWVELLVDPGAYWAAARPLLRPPLQVDPALLRQWQAAYRAGPLRGGDQAPAEGFVAFVRQRAPDEPAVQRFSQWYDELSKLAMTNPAHEVLFRIMTLTDVAHADLLPERERARRVRNLVALLRFARTRQPMLDGAGDLAAFWAYYNDLDDDDQKLVEEGERRVDHVPDQSEDEADVVHLLTAHRVKGLEFDTVFVTPVKPPHGFPRTASRNDGPTLPADLLGDSLEDLTVKRLGEEERRIFYVACTRAKRRLVLFGQRGKSRSPGTHFYHELVWDEPGGSLVVERTADELLEEATALGARAAQLEPLAGEGRSTDSPGIQLVVRARSEARRVAAAALDAASFADLDDDTLTRLREQAGEAILHTAIASHLEAHGQLPGWIATAPAAVQAWARQLAQAMQEASTAGVALLEPLSPPLHLSYSQISDYLRCPACYYVKHVLKLAEPPTSRLALGSAAHRALERFYRLVQQAQADGSPMPDLQQLLACGRQAWEELVSKSDGEAQRSLGEQLEAMLTQTFHKLYDPAADILDLERDIQFDYPYGGHTHTLTVRIDRIDRLSDGRVRLIDYKTGRATKAKLEPERKDLQLGMYAMALQATLPEASASVSGMAEFWVLPEGKRGAIPLEQLDLEAVRAAINEVIGGLLAGRYARKKDCQGVCRLVQPD